MLGQRYCVFCGTLRSEPTANHAPDCQYRKAIEHSSAPSYPWHSTESDKRPIMPQRVESHPNIVQTANEKIVDDIRNKLSSAYTFIQIAYEEGMSMEARELTRKQAWVNFNYLIERLKEIK